MEPAAAVAGGETVCKRCILKLPEQPEIQPIYVFLHLAEQTETKKNHTLTNYIIT